jgi:hypothetical protein
MTIRFPFHRLVISAATLISAATTSAPLQAQTPPATTVTRTFRFANGSSGMLPIFTDYNLNTADFRFLAEIRNLPDEIAPDRQSRRAFYIRSNNRSDDVFMGLKAVLTEPDDKIVPNQPYLLNFVIEFASNSSACPGIGGSPGLSVFLKAGGSTLEPVPLLMPNNYVSINVDKGQQMTGGMNLSVVSNVDNGRTCDDPRWVMLKQTYQHPFPIRSSPSGDIWITVATESGYEGLSDFYFRKITVTLTPVKS